VTARDLDDCRQGRTSRRVTSIEAVIGGSSSRFGKTGVRRHRHSVRRRRCEGLGRGHAPQGRLPLYRRRRRLRLRLRARRQVAEGQIIGALGATNVFATGNDAPNGQNYDFERAVRDAGDADFFIVYDEPEAIATTLADPRFQPLKPFVTGDYVGRVEGARPECAATFYLYIETSHQPKLSSSRCRRGGQVRAEGFVGLVELAGDQAVVELAEHAVEQLPQRGDVPSGR
jgi:hypothetical protein